MEKYIGYISRIVNTRQCWFLIISFLFFFQYSFAQPNATPKNLLPGAKVYDVTKPESWGGRIKATPNDASDDDALAINQAIQAAVNFTSKNFNEKGMVFQQVIFIPEGDYHLESSIVVPPLILYPGGEKVNKKENAIWIYGQGMDKTKFILKNASEIGLFGLSDSPKPLIQYAQYTYGQEGAGNLNFQLWATDYSIVIPEDQPNAIGLSYGCANMGGVRNLHIIAEGNAGHTGFALIQYNNGPGWVEHVTIEGFDTGIEISDGFGEIYSFSDIKLRNQNQGGKALCLSDKMIAIERLTSEQDELDILPVFLYDNDSENSDYGGAPHLTLLNSSFYAKNGSTMPVLQIETGHCFIRNIYSQGYGDTLIIDHGVFRKFKDGTIKGEYVAAHGKTEDEESKVVITYKDSPAQSLNLPLPITPEVSQEVWDELSKGNYTVVSEKNLDEGILEIESDWVIVDPSQSDDDSQLLQAALNSGARFVGLLNNESFQISKNIVINKNKGKVELIYGYMSEIFTEKSLRLREDPDVPNNKILFTLETGSAKALTIKGIRILTDDRINSDFLLFQNNSSQRIIFEDIRCKDAPRAYRNGKDSYGKEVFFENVEFAYTGIYYDVIMQFDNQRAYARQFNLEAPIMPQPVVVNGREYKRFTSLPKLLNNGSEICVLSQKLGEMNGVYVETTNGGKTELLSAFFNGGRNIGDDSSESLLTNFLVSGKNSDFCLVGQERVRTIMENGNATLPLPNGNKFGIIIDDGRQFVIEGTSLPTYLKYTGLNPFNDTAYETYDRQNHFRLVGLFRAKIK